ncbi:hypothetical protein P3T40_001211 [Paraburkholderia sp. EB58]|jgi:hypothetical protein
MTFPSKYAISAISLKLPVSPRDGIASKSTLYIDPTLYFCRE